MKYSKYQEKRIDLVKEEAVMLRKKGYSLREIGAVINHNHEWVRKALKEKMGDDYM